MPGEDVRPKPTSPRPAGFVFGPVLIRTRHGSGSRLRDARSPLPQETGIQAAALFLPGRVRGLGATEGQPGGPFVRFVPVPVRRAVVPRVVVVPRTAALNPPVYDSPPSEKKTSSEYRTVSTLCGKVQDGIPETSPGSQPPHSRTGNSPPLISKKRPGCYAPWPPKR